VLLAIPRLRRGDTNDTNRVIASGLRPLAMTEGRSVLSFAILIH